MRYGHLIHDLLSILVTTPAPAPCSLATDVLTASAAVLCNMISHRLCILDSPFDRSLPKSHAELGTAAVPVLPCNMVPRSLLTVWLAHWADSAMAASRRAASAGPT